MGGIDDDGFIDTRHGHCPLRVCDASYFCALVREPFFPGRRVSRLHTCGTHCLTDNDAPEVRSPPRAVTIETMFASLPIVTPSYRTPSPGTRMGIVTPSPTKVFSDRKNDPAAQKRHFVAGRWGDYETFDKLAIANKRENANPYYRHKK